MRKILAVFSMAAALALPAVASAQVLNFDDTGLSPNSIAFNAPGSNYHGFNFVFGSAQGGLFSIPYASAGYAVSSGTTAMFFNDIMTMTSSTASIFSVSSAYFSSYNTSHNITASGWLSGVQIYTTTFAGNPTAAQLQTLSFDNIDRFDVSTDAMTSFVDDINLSTTAPEPASIVLMATGLAGLGIRVRRRRR